MPKILQSIKQMGNSQLAWDDVVIHLDHDIRMGLLMFNSPEPSPAECETIRLHNWMERARSAGEKTSIKAELAEVTEQIGKISEIREVERAIPRAQFASDICFTGLSLGMQYIATELTSETYTEFQACNTTYDTWYQRLRTTTVAGVEKRWT